MLKKRSHKRKTVAGAATKIYSMAFGVSVLLYHCFKPAMIIVGVNIKYFIGVSRGLFVPMFGMMQELLFCCAINIKIGLRFMQERNSQAERMFLF